MNGFYWEEWDLGFSSFSSFGELLFTLLLLLLGISPKKDRETSIGTLKRLAKGEVTEEEFEKIKRNFKKASSQRDLFKFPYPRNSLRSIVSKSSYCSWKDHFIKTFCFCKKEKTECSCHEKKKPEIRKASRKDNISKLHPKMDQ